MWSSTKFGNDSYRSKPTFCWHSDYLLLLLKSGVCKIVYDTELVELSKAAFTIPNWLELIWYCTVNENSVLLTNWFGYQLCIIFISFRWTIDSVLFGFGIWSTIDAIWGYIFMYVYKQTHIPLLLKIVWVVIWSPPSPRRLVGIMECHS